MIVTVLRLLPWGDTRLLIPGFAINVIVLFSFGALGKPKKWSREKAVTPPQTDKNVSTGHVRLLCSLVSASLRTNLPTKEGK